MFEINTFNEIRKKDLKKNNFTWFILNLVDQKISRGLNLQMFLRTKRCLTKFRHFSPVKQPKDASFLGQNFRQPQKILSLLSDRLFCLIRQPNFIFFGCVFLRGRLDFRFFLRGHSFAKSALKLILKNAITFRTMSFIPTFQIRKIKRTK